MYVLSLKGNEINFKSLEKEIFELVCREACKIIIYILEELDEKLMKERDKKKYRHKGKKKTSIKTVMGTIEYERRIYEYTTEEGEKKYIFPLDEYLKIKTIGQISANLVEKIVDNITDMSYRKAVEKITKHTNQSISHTAVWDIIQKIGEKIEEKEEREIKLNKQGKLKGEKEVKVIFEEMDGIWLNIQGKNKGKTKKKVSKELKMGIFYEVFEKKHEKKIDI